jgi:hypothetical protein
VDTETPRPEKLVVDFDTTVNSSPTDISGQGNHGAFYGTNMNYSSADKAFAFNGTNDYIQTGLSINAVGTPQHTFSLWVKPSAGDMDDTVNHYICVWGNTTAQNSWSGLALKSGGLAHVYHSSGKYTSDVLFTTNNWHHIVVVIKSTTATTAIGRDVDFYVDGVLYSGSYSTLGSNAGNSAYYLDWGSGTSTRVRLGSLLSGGEDSSSSISNFKLYSVALEASEVRKLYNLGRTGRSMVISDTAVGIGKVPEAQLDVRGGVIVRGSLTLPTVTTSGLTTGVTGMIRFNTGVGKLEFYNGTLWSFIGGVSATGGTITEVSGYKIHTFTSSGTFTVIAGGSVEYLVVAGGGGGGSGNGGGGMGGGGAGGLLTSSVTIGPNTYTVTVGDGGVGGSSSGTILGTNGTDSSISFPIQVIADGGGKGATSTNNDTTPGSSGGSGGGGGGSNGVGGVGGTGTSGPPRQGYNGGQGGNGTSGSVYKGGGGGGAGAVGQSYTSSTSISAGLNGGNGVQSSMNGSATYYAGGGGGGNIVGSYANAIYGGSGGLGGGGDGGDAINSSTLTNGDAGTPNTGGGGGAGAYLRNGGGGGSGIVIIIYRQ